MRLKSLKQKLNKLWGIGQVRAIRTNKQLSLKVWFLVRETTHCRLLTMKRTQKGKTWWLNRISCTSTTRACSRTKWEPSKTIKNFLSARISMISRCLRRTIFLNPRREIRVVTRWKTKILTISKQLKHHGKTIKMQVKMKYIINKVGHLAMLRKPWQNPRWKTTSPGFRT